MWRTVHLHFGTGFPLILFAIQSRVRRDAYENYGRYHFFFFFFPRPSYNETRTETMTELRENCTWRRCSASRARFRLKLYEPAVKCLGDVEPAEILGCFDLRSTLKYFYPDTEGVLSRSFSLIRHSSRFVYMYMYHSRIPRLFLSSPLENSHRITLASAMSAAINRGRHLRWNQEICNVWRVAVLTDSCRRARYFYFTYFISVRYIRGKQPYKRPLWRYLAGEMASRPITREHG